MEPLHEKRFTLLQASLSSPTNRRIDDLPDFDDAFTRRRRRGGPSDERERFWSKVTSSVVLNQSSVALNTAGGAGPSRVDHTTGGVSSSFLVRQQHNKNTNSTATQGHHKSGTEQVDVDYNNPFNIYPAGSSSSAFGGPPKLGSTSVSSGLVRVRARYTRLARTAGDQLDLSIPATIPEDVRVDVDEGGEVVQGEGSDDVSVAVSVRTMRSLNRPPSTTGTFDAQERAEFRQGIRGLDEDYVQRSRNRHQVGRAWSLWR